MRLLQPSIFSKYAEPYQASKLRSLKKGLKSLESHRIAIQGIGILLNLEKKL